MYFLYLLAGVFASIVVWTKSGSHQPIMMKGQEISIRAAIHRAIVLYTGLYGQT